MDKRKSIIKIAVFSLLVLAVMVMIYCFSAETGEESTSTSNGVTSWVIRLFRPDFDALSEAEREDIFSIASHYVRKGAHFSEYALLGLFSTLLLLSVMEYLQKKKVCFFAVLPPLFCLLYAVFDEGHQYFVGGRAAQFTDVLIDFSGAFSATLFVLLLRFICIRIKRKKSRNAP